MFDKVLNTPLIIASITISKTVPTELLTLSRNLNVQTDRVHHPILFWISRSVPINKYKLKINN